MKRLLIIFLFIISVLTLSAQQSNYCIENRFSETPLFDVSEIGITTLQYAAAVEWPFSTIDTLLLDLFYPYTVLDNLDKRPFILFIHGGAFMTGNRNEMDQTCLELARRGFVTATIDYRLGWICPTANMQNMCLLCTDDTSYLVAATYRAVQDARAAMRFVVENAGLYHIDTSFLFIGGLSAGSITALHTTFWNQQEANQFCPWCEATLGTLDTVGNNLTHSFSIKAVVDNCGAVNNVNIMLNNPDIPVISFHDEVDCSVPNTSGQILSCYCNPFYSVQGSYSVFSALSLNGVCAEMNLVPMSVGHCSYPPPNLYRRSACFLKRLMCNQCQSEFINDVNAVVDCDTLGLVLTYGSDINPETGLRVYPNPASNEFTIEVTAGASFEITLRDISGRNIWQESNVHSSFAFGEGLSSGYYLLELKNEEGERFQFKIVKTE